MNENEKLSELYKELNRELEQLSSYTSQQNKIIESLNKMINYLMPIGTEYKKEFTNLNDEVTSFKNLIDGRMEENKLNIDAGVKLIGESKAELKDLIDQTSKDLKNAAERDTVLITQLQKEIQRIEINIQDVNEKVSTISEEVSTISKRQELVKEVKKSLKK
tara:strand:- start:234 stop:719 length:486 start_codon:yes stop_codon:yes gene_type:complete